MVHGKRIERNNSRLGEHAEVSVKICELLPVLSELNQFVANESRRVDFLVKTGLRVASRARHSRRARLPLAGNDLRLNAFARFWEGEPPGEPWHHPARTEPRPPGITQGHLAEALCYRGRQLDGTRIDQGGRPEIRNVAEADPGFGVGTPQRSSVARVAE